MWSNKETIKWIQLFNNAKQEKNTLMTKYLFKQMISSEFFAPCKMSRVDSETKEKYVETLFIPEFGLHSFTPWPMAYEGKLYLFMGTDGDSITNLAKQSTDGLSVMSFGTPKLLRLVDLIKELEGLVLYCFDTDTKKNYSLLFDRYLVNFLITAFDL